MFEDPEYIAFCRELRLEHKFEIGDYFIDFWDGFTEHQVQLVTDQMQALQLSRQESAIVDPVGGTVWAPRLDQWFAMIRSTWASGGGPDICLWGDDEVGFGCETDYKSVQVRGEGHTPEEAAGRLWMAVTGKLGRR
jgi:hypothetical protein